jgi:hypothetical protein
MASVEAIETAAQHVLHCAQLVADDSKQAKFLFHSEDIDYHKTIGGVLTRDPLPLEPTLKAGVWRGSCQRRLLTRCSERIQSCWLVETEKISGYWQTLKACRLDS